MYEDVPKWLRPFLRPDAYDPDDQFVDDLVPQSRTEALLKFLIRETTRKFEGFFDSNGNKFVTSEGLDFSVRI